MKSLVHALGRAYINRICRSEAEAQKFRRHNERSIEFAFVFDAITRFRPVDVLDAGTGTTALPSLIASCGCVVTAIDNVRDYWPAGMMNRHWQVIDDDIRSPRTRPGFDLVTCVSVIEHIEDHRSAFSQMVSLAKPGGLVLITTPYNEREAVPNVYKLPGAAYGQDLSYICRSTSRREVDAWMAATGAEIVTQDYWEFWTGTVWTQGQILPVPRKVTPQDSHQLTCILARVPG